MTIPETEPDIAAVAALFREPARAAMLLALLDGRALPAGELSYRAGIMPQTASAHLAKMIDGNLLTVEHAGRHRYYRLAGPEVGLAIEALAALAPISLRPEPEREAAIHHARTCYDHLAGKLGVAVADWLLAKGMLETGGRDYGITESGSLWLTGFGIDVTAIQTNRRTLARQCLDWSERRHHIAGALGAALLDQFLRRGWVKRMPEGRALRLTATGRDGFRRHFDLRL